MDDVTHPSHYTQGSVECIEGIKAALGEHFEAHCIGCVIKYVWRYRDKNNPLQDLLKARQYLDWAIEARKEKEGEDVRL